MYVFINLTGLTNIINLARALATIMVFIERTILDILNNITKRATIETKIEGPEQCHGLAHGQETWPGTIIF